MNRRDHRTGSPYEEKFCYSRAVVRGDWCFVAGTTGFDPKTGTVPGDPAEQTRRAFATIRATMAEAGFEPSEIVRIRYIITDPAVQEAIAPAIREALGSLRPAATMVVAGLVHPDMAVEIEVTAYRGG